MLLFGNSNLFRPRLRKARKQKPMNQAGGTYTEFVEALKKTFQPYNELAEALEDMKKLHLGNSSITEHNSITCVPDRDEGFPSLNRLILGNVTLGPTEPDYPIQIPPKDS
jgi:hypothetical protein